MNLSRLRPLLTLLSERAFKKVVPKPRHRSGCAERHRGGVALPSEAVTLRQAGDNVRILAWLWALGDLDLEFWVAAGVDFGVSNLESLKSVVAAAQSTGVQARIQLKDDTGLWRNGCPISDWGNLVAEVLEVCEREPAAIEVTAV